MLPDLLRSIIDAAEKIFILHYDLWQNPAVKAQTTYCACFIDQHKNVLVHHFITQNAFEECVAPMI